MEISMRVACEKLKNLKTSLGRFPTVQELSDELNVSREETVKFLDILAQRDIIKHEYSSYNDIKKRNTEKITMLILRIILGIIGLGCILVSIKFTYSFNTLTMPKVWGFILSASLITFTSFCFTVRDKVEDKRKNLFVAFYIIGIIYSIFTAVAGQYNDYLINNKITFEHQNKENVNGKKVELLEEQKNRIKEQIDVYKKQIESQQKIIDDLSNDPEKKIKFNNTWKQTLELIKDYQNEINELENKLNEININIISSEEISVDKKLNIFDWISNMFKVSGDLIQFIISLFPAIFIDLVSPFAISFAFLDRNK